MPENARQTFCRPCAAERRREQNARHDAARRQRDRDRRLAERDGSGGRGPAGLLVPDRDASRLSALLGVLHDAVSGFLEAQDRRLVAQGDLEPEPDEEVLDTDDATAWEIDAAARAADAADEFLSSLPSLLPSGLLPPALRPHGG